MRLRSRDNFIGDRDREPMDIEHQEEPYSRGVERQRHFRSEAPLRGRLSDNACKESIKNFKHATDRGRNMQNYNRKSEIDLLIAFMCTE